MHNRRVLDEGRNRIEHKGNYAQMLKKDCCALNFLGDTQQISIEDAIRLAYTNPAFDTAVSRKIRADENIAALKALALYYVYLDLWLEYSRKIKKSKKLDNKLATSTRLVKFFRDNPGALSAVLSTSSKDIKKNNDPLPKQTVTTPQPTPSGVTSRLRP